MKKNYNVPATEVVAFASGMLMVDPASPGSSFAVPGGAGGGATIPGEG